MQRIQRSGLGINDRTEDIFQDPLTRGLAYTGSETLLCNPRGKIIINLALPKKNEHALTHTSVFITQSSFHLGLLTMQAFEFEIFNKAMGKF
jgi:hypothetical protein